MSLTLTEFLRTNKQRLREWPKWKQDINIYGQYHDWRFENTSVKHVASSYPNSMQSYEAVSNGWISPKGEYIQPNTVLRRSTHFEMAERIIDSEGIDANGKHPVQVLIDLGWVRVQNGYSYEASIKEVSDAAWARVLDIISHCPKNVSMFGVDMGEADVVIKDCPYPGGESEHLNVPYTKVDSISLLKRGRIQHVRSASTNLKKATNRCSPRGVSNGFLSPTGEYRADRGLHHFELAQEILDMDHTIISKLTDMCLESSVDPKNFLPLLRRVYPIEALMLCGWVRVINAFTYEVHVPNLTTKIASAILKLVTDLCEDKALTTPIEVYPLRLKDYEVEEFYKEGAEELLKRLKVKPEQTEVHYLGMWAETEPKHIIRGGRRMKVRRTASAGFRPLTVLVADKLPGGKGDNTKPSEVDQKELAMGIKEEMEHTDDPEIAEEIALDHLTETPNYYSKMKKLEGATTMLYFGYGSNMDVAQMRRRCPTATIYGPGHIKNRRLAFCGQSGLWNGGVATVLPAPGKTVYGLIWLLKQSDLDSLDHYEGHPGFYERKMITTVDEKHGGTVKTWVYILEGRAETRPSPEYLNVIKKAYIKYGWDMTELNKVQTTADRTTTVTPSMPVSQPTRFRVNPKTLTDSQKRALGDEVLKVTRSKFNNWKRGIKNGTVHPNAALIPLVEVIDIAADILSEIPSNVRPTGFNIKLREKAPLKKRRTVADEILGAVSSMLESWTQQKGELKDVKYTVIAKQLAEWFDKVPSNDWPSNLPEV